MADDKDELFQEAARAGPAPDEGIDASAGTSEKSATPIHPAGAASEDDSLGKEAASRTIAPETVAAGQPKVERPAKKLKQPSRAPVLVAALIVGALGGFGGAFALRALDEKQQGAGEGDRVAELNALIVELEHKSEASASALAAIEGRLTAAENSAGKASASADSVLKKLQTELAERPKAAGETHDVSVPDIAPLETKITTLGQKLSALETELAKPKIDVRAQQDREAATQSARALAAAPSKAVAALSLLQLVTRGEPFADELAALDSLGEDPAKLAPLRATAKTGVASVSALAEQFAALAPTLDAPPAQKQDGGILDRLARDASNLVRIRRAGDPNDPDLPGRVAALEKALARSDVAKAYAIWSELPNEAKARSAAWGEAAKARLDAVAAASAIEADAVTALGKPKS